MDDFGCIPCSSCGVILVNGSGKGIRPWGHSHNLPVAHYKHLEADRGNFAQRCQNWEGREGCHEKLDNFNFECIKDFIDLDNIMNYRKIHDINSYNKFVSGLKKVGYEKFDYII